MNGNKWFLVLNRITFISNSLFILCVLFRYFPLKLPEFVVGFMIILGWAPLSPLLNFATAFSFLMFAIKGIKTDAKIWILGFNFFWLIFQLFYFILV